MQQYLVISALGEDRPGVASILTETVVNCNCKIIECQMSVLGKQAAIYMLLSGSWDAIAKIEDALPGLTKKYHLSFNAIRSELSSHPTPLVPYFVQIITTDNSSVVHSISEFFANERINIKSLSTETYYANHTGTKMLLFNLLITIPTDLSIPDLRERFMLICDDLNLDAIMEPEKY